MRIARSGGRRVRLLVAALASILASLTGSPIATAQAPAAQVTLTPIAENETAHAGSTVRLALEATIAEGLHAQANHPRDPLLIPMQLFIDAPTGVSYVDAAFPAAIEFEIAGEPNPVFTGTFLVGARIVIAKDQPVGSVTIPGRLR
jgi:DsbC/DsbD-like thiol-disulfide interchange protein